MSESERLLDEVNYAHDVAARGGTVGPFYNRKGTPTAGAPAEPENRTMTLPTPAVQDVPGVLLRAAGYRVLVRMPERKLQTESGLYKPDRTAEMEQLAANVGEVVGVGEYCYPADKYPNGPWCSVGDWVIFRSYSGTKVKLRGRDYRLLNDDAIEAVTSVPEEVEKG
jgi:co-chaperonin GroES (HSP10)